MDAPAAEGRAEDVRPGSRERPLSVSQTVGAAGRVLQQRIGTVWIEGEIASLSRPSSGHLYFSLKDQRSQMRAVMWRSAAQRLRFRIEDGQTLRCHGELGIYERDGKFQFYAKYAEPAGLGAEALALEQLKRKLAAEGLFDEARKRPLPPLPRRIGLVTSKSGAAVRDVIRAVQRRFPVPILVADAVVQGREAPARIVRALRAIAQTDVDLVIVGRGGGAASDLAAFNDEQVVRAVAACPVPVISAVGHEIDMSLTDLAADRRAATPTAAGEMAVPVLADLAALLVEEERRLHRELSLLLQDYRQELDQLARSADAAWSRTTAARRRALGELRTRLEMRHPRAQLVAHRGVLSELENRMHVAEQRRRERARRELEQLSERVHTAGRQRLDGAGRDFALLVARLRAMSPLQVLERGYALAVGPAGVVTDAAQLAPGDALQVRLARGELDCRVESVHPPGADGGEGSKAKAKAKSKSESKSKSTSKATSKKAAKAPSTRARRRE
ncbi:exodeoxyribonuclease VII, large subunit [Haliangium ochraceum DSM 14365]|uniref:Exodeoxyribonuclease 7 large subunit n=1 Tax=Haliangium ochraceum (strain DSM 14365 / JCM 11303 / SMP-2) TaxID=502025 RepID=D0LUE8_HALO1|nr:exodeoxyribonuclease VII, large subunit [Haliangium ochraceum DSM 14365]